MAILGHSDFCRTCRRPFLWIADKTYSDIVRELFEVLGGPEHVSVFLGPDDPQNCPKCGISCRLIFTNTGEHVPPWLISDFYEQWEEADFPSEPGKLG